MSWTLLPEGRLRLKQALKPSSIPFVPSPQEVVRRMLELAQVRPGDVVYDLGCGDGRIILDAALKFDAKAVGIEARQDLVEMVSSKIRSKGLEERVSVIKGDLFSTPLRNASVLALYLTPKALEALKPRMELELRPGTRVVTHDYPIKGWKPIAVEKVYGRRIYLYEKPS